MGRRANKNGYGMQARRRRIAMLITICLRDITCMQRHAEAQASRLCLSCHVRSLLEAEQRLSSGREMVRFESHRRGMEIEERTAPPIQRTQLTFLVEQQRGAAFSRPSKVGRRSCRGEAIRQ